MQQRKPVLYYKSFEVINLEINMDKNQLKMGKKDGAKKVSESFKKLLKQKPSQELIDALKRIKEKEKASQNKRVAADRNIEV
jgi:hypothetical protein